MNYKYYVELHSSCSILNLIRLFQAVLICLPYKTWDEQSVWTKTTQPAQKLD